MRRSLMAVAVCVGMSLGCSNANDRLDAGQAGVGGVAGSGGSGGSGGGACSPACGQARECCGDRCVNLQNDPKNCGACGATCGDGTYCGGGECIAPPCTSTCTGGATCCGSQCCSPGQLCCDPQGPLDMGPRCAEPDEHGSCTPGCAPLCICADPDTPIATPTGSRPIASLRAGELVYSVDGGQLVVVPIARTQRTPVSAHRVMRVTLSSGAVLEISAGHPTADGRRFQDLRAGEALDGVAITAVEVVPYEHDATYDILPASDTGAYFAAGVLVGSTLALQPRQVMEPTAPLDHPAE